MKRSPKLAAFFVCVSKNGELTRGKGWKYNGCIELYIYSYHCVLMQNLLVMSVQVRGTDFCKK